MNELNALRAMADEDTAARMEAYHKVPRIYLGVAKPQLDMLVAQWRASLDLESRIDLAAVLWASDIHEARVAAAKLLIQARIRPDDAAWSLIAGWVAELDGLAIADAVMIAGQKRIVANPQRLDQVETWLNHPNSWTRRAALVGGLPWAKMNNPKPGDLVQRQRVLGWAAILAGERDWFIQKAVAWWLCDLSKRDVPVVQEFLAEHGARMKPFARKEVEKSIQDR